MNLAALLFSNQKVFTFVCFFCVFFYNKTSFIVHKFEINIKWRIAKCTTGGLQCSNDSIYFSSEVFFYSFLVNALALVHVSFTNYRGEISLFNQYINWVIVSRSGRSWPIFFLFFFCRYVHVAPGLKYSEGKSLSKFLQTGSYKPASRPF